MLDVTNRRFIGFPLSRDEFALSGNWWLHSIKKSGIKLVLPIYFFDGSCLKP
jgi:hypothetical protein